MLVHHAFASFVLLSAMFHGQHLLGAGILAMMSELSSVFLSVQFMYNSGPVKKNTPFLVFNQMMFVFTYTTNRMILFPVLFAKLIPA
jgi:hypothetical protein